MIDFSFWIQASKSQMDFMKSYPEMAEQLSQIASGMP